MTDRFPESRGVVDLTLWCEICQRWIDVTAYATNGQIDPDTFTCVCGQIMTEER